MFHENAPKQIIIFCGGTGIFPFFDTLDFLLKKSILDLIPLNFKATLIKKMDPKHLGLDEDMRKVNCQVKLYGAFKNESEFYGLSWI